MYCQKCGNPLQEGALFCVKCGAPVGDAQAPLVSERKAPARSGSRLIVPAIFAIAAAAVFLVCWFSDLRHVNWMIHESQSEPVLAVYAFNNLLENLFWITGAVLLFVFCLTARKSKKTFLFALACLAFAGGFAFNLLIGMLSVVIAGYGITWFNAFSWILCSAGAVLFLLEAIIAFKGRVHKLIGILAASAMFAVLALDILVIGF